MTHGRPIVWNPDLKNMIEGQFYNPRNRKQSLQMAGANISLSKWADVMPRNPRLMEAKAKVKKIKGPYQLPKFAPKAENLTLNIAAIK